MTDLPAGPQLIAGASRFLIEGGENEAASVLLSCTVESLWADETDSFNPPPALPVCVTLVGPRAAYDLVSDYLSDVQAQIRGAIAAVVPHPLWLRDINIRAGLVTLEPDWHAEMVEMARGRDVNNQAPGTGADKVGNRLRFRSATEVRIAEALDRRGVLFFPLCALVSTVHKAGSSVNPTFWFVTWGSGAS